MIKFLKKAISPFFVLSHEGIFALWLLFMPICGFISTVKSLVAGNYTQVFNDGTFYTYSIGILMPLIFDTLISFVVAIRSKEEIHFIQLKIGYLVFAVISVLLSGIFYSLEEAKTSIIFQICVFIFSSIIASLLYFSMQMSRFQSLKEKYDDRGYEDEEKANIDALEQSVNPHKALSDKDGVKI